MKTLPSPLALSVVVIGRNEGLRLRRCLDSLEHLKPTAELIYVDSASTDGSPAVASAGGAQVIRLTEGRMNAARARNAGWRAAAGRLVLFLDGDTILHPDFVQEALAHFEESDVAVVWGHRREIQPPTSLYNRVLDLDWICPPGDSEFCGGDAVMLRSVLDECTGFDETLIAGEEPEMCQRFRARGYRILHIDRPMTLHDLAVTRFGQYWKRAVRAGHAYAEVSSRFQHKGFWRRDSRRNLTLGSLYAAGIAGACVSSVVFHSVIPLAAALSAFLAISLRAAWRQTWRCQSGLTCLLYGVHSHIQHIPICWGQILYFWRSRSGRPSRLIEYKKAV